VLKRIGLPTSLNVIPPSVRHARPTIAHHALAEELDLGLDLRIPEDFDLLAVSIICDAGQPKGGQVGLCVVDSLDKPGPAAHLDELPRLENTGDLLIASDTVT
jgi:hypothetical protein